LTDDQVCYVGSVVVGSKQGDESYLYICKVYVCSLQDAIGLNKII